MKKRGSFSTLLRNAMKCLCSGEQLRVDEMVRSSESQAAKDSLTDHYSYQNSEVEQRVDTGNIEEAESSLREGLCLNYEVGLSKFLVVLLYLEFDKF